MAASPKSAGSSWLSRLLSLAPRSAKNAAASNLVFPPDFLASLERLRLVALKAMGGGLREGHRLGAYKGGQLEFHGHRSYSPGDELRYIDWNTYARTGKPFVKEFAREEAGVLHVLLDATPSMALGHPTKWTFARRLAALFAHVALSSKDAIYIYAFRGTDSLEQFPARGAKGGIREGLAFLENCIVASAPSAVQQQASRVPDNGANGGALGRAVSRFLRGSPARGRAIVVSDFWQDEREIVGAVSRLAASGFDVSAIHVLAPEEIQPHAEGELLARSLEEDAEIELSAGSDLAERYARELESHRKAIEECIRKRGGNYLLADSETSIERVLINTLRQRRWVM